MTNDSELLLLSENDDSLLMLLGDNAPRDIRRIVYRYYLDHRNKGLVLALPYRLPSPVRHEPFVYTFFIDPLFREYPYTTTQSCYLHPHIQLKTTHTGPYSIQTEMCQSCYIRNIMSLRSGSIVYPFR